MLYKIDFISKWTTYFLKFLFFSIYFTVLLLCLFSFRIDYAYKLGISDYNLIWLTFGMLSLILVILVLKNIKINKKLFKLLPLILFLLQLVLLSSYFFITNWDALEIFNNAVELANKNFSNLNNDYYSMYPNNIFITVIYSKLIEWATFLGYSEDSLFFILSIQSVINVITGILIYTVTKKITQNQMLSCIAYLFYIILLWFSPWTSIPYSDSFGLFFPILMLYLYVMESSNVFLNYLRVAFIVFVSIIGYAIKPHSIILAIGLVIITLFVKNIKFSKLLLTIGIVIVTAFCTRLFVTSVNNNAGFSLNPEAEMTYHHFFKMGLNTVTDGGYSAKDFYESTGINNKNERQKNDIAIAKERIRVFGGWGLVKHQIKKTLNNFNDGTFAWGREGSFFFEIFENDSFIAMLTRNLYYDTGQYRYIFEGITQTLWIVILMLILGTVFYNTSENKEVVILLWITLIGVFLFESLFESRARYIYTYSPVFIVLSVIGLQTIFQKLDKLPLLMKFRGLGEKNEQK
jgi:putative membrane protein